MGTDPKEEFWCTQRLVCRLRWFFTVTKVVLHSNRGEFSCRSRWFCIQIEVILDWHASRGRMDCTDQRQILGIVPRRAFWVQFGNISSLYSKVSFFCKDSRSSFSFFIQASRQKSAHKTFHIHRKVSMFILKSLRISSCSCCWSLLLYMTDRNQKSLCKHLNT